MIFPPLTPPELSDKPHSRPMPGNGTQTVVYGDMAAVSARVMDLRFRHPFQALITAGGLQIAKGLVEVFTPKIGKVPIDGDARNGVPILKLVPKIANKEGESWVCIEVEPGAQLDANGKPQLAAGGKPTLRATLDGASRIEIVHTNEPLSMLPAIGRCPIVQLVWNGNRVARVFQIVHFNLRYQRVDPADGAGAVRHLFF